MCRCFFFFVFFFFFWWIRYKWSRGGVQPRDHRVWQGWRPALCAYSVAEGRDAWLTVLLGDHTQRLVWEAWFHLPPPFCSLAASHCVFYPLSSSCSPPFAYSLHSHIALLDIPPPSVCLQFSAWSYLSSAPLIPLWLSIYWLPPVFHRAPPPPPFCLPPAASSSSLAVCISSCSFSSPPQRFHSVRCVLSSSLSVCFSCRNCIAVCRAAGSIYDSVQQWAGICCGVRE